MIVLKTPICCMTAARLVVSRVLPTPPLPFVTAITFDMHPPCKLVNIHAKLRESVKRAPFLGDWLNRAALPARFPLASKRESGPGFQGPGPRLRGLKWFALLLLRRRRIWRCGNL